MIACPSCGTQTGVRETRAVDGGIRRRRLCPKCGHRLTTIEAVVARSGARPGGDVVVVSRKKLRELGDLVATILPGPVEEA